MFRSSSVVLLCAVLVLGCEPTRKRCSNIRCDNNRVCDEATGLCVKGDGGTVTPVVDAGTKDAGTADAGLACSPACAGGKVCDPATVTCVACVSSAQCACPTPVCDPASHTCLGALPDAGPLLQPVGESCNDAMPILFPQCSPTATSFRLDLGALNDDVQGTCSADGGLGRDAVFLLNVPAVSDVRVSTAQSPGSTAEAVTYLRMAPCATGPELVCKDSFGAPSSFRSKNVAPGVYALVVDSYDQLRSGLVDVTVELLPGITNETCAAPLPAPLDGGALTVDLSGASDDLKGTCNSGADSRDVVYQFTLNQKSDFTALVAAVNADAGTDPVVYVRGAPCAADAGNELACVDTTNPTERLSLRGLDAGTYYLVVEGYRTAGNGPVRLTSWATPPVPFPPNDTCGAPRVIDLTTASSASFTVDTAAALDHFQGSCASFGVGGLDAVYTFTLTAPRTVTITTETAAGDEVDPVVYLRSTPCGTDAGVELGCADDYLAPEVLVRALPAGTYFLYVDSYSASSAGPTLVTVTVQ